jgi:alkanesulfonate monooxygenase SsuD/methylene tetrahydromethanopterin reductase-like flavin-dependent oxidoreductase (luciferase family)
MAAATENIGFGVTVATTYEQASDDERGSL